MATKFKPGMYCTACDRAVSAQKSTSRIRNTFAIGASVTTLGGSLLAAKVNGWHCPTCGGPVVKASTQGAPTSNSNASAATSPAVRDEIERLDRLRQRGVLSAAEFQAYKARLLSSGSAS